MNNRQNAVEKFIEVENHRIVSRRRLGAAKGIKLLRALEIFEGTVPLVGFWSRDNRQGMEPFYKFGEPVLREGAKKPETPTVYTLGQCNFNTGFCLVGNKETKDDTAKRPTLEDVYHLKTIRNAAQATDGTVIVWLPDSAYADVNNIYWQGHDIDKKEIERLTAVYEAFCRSIGINCHVLRMSGMDSEIEELSAATEGVKKEIKSFYGVPEHLINDRQRMLLHKYACTIAVLAEDNVVPDPSRHIVNLVMPEDRDTVEHAQRLLDYRERANVTSMLAINPLYSVSRRPGCDRMFDDLPEDKIYVNESMDKTREKLSRINEGNAEVLGAWCYLLSRAFRTEIQNVGDIIGMLEQARTDLRGYA